MAVMMGRLYAALREAGVADEKALGAAEEMAVVNDVGGLKDDVARVRSDVSGIKSDISTLKAEGAVMKWMLGFALAMLVAIVGKLFIPH